MNSEEQRAKGVSDRRSLFRSSLFRRIVDEQAGVESDSAIECGYCHGAHKFTIDCITCGESFPGSIAMYSPDAEHDAFVLVAGYCHACGTLNLRSDICPVKIKEARNAGD